MKNSGVKLTLATAALFFAMGLGGHNETSATETGCGVDLVEPCGGNKIKNTNRNTNYNNNTNIAKGGKAHSNSNASSYASGGKSKATGGNSDSHSNSSTGPISITENYDSPLPIGIAPSVYIQPTGNCGEGWSLSVGAPYTGIGGGKSSQSRTCLSQNAALSAINAGLVKKDNGLVAVGLGALLELHEEFKTATSIVSQNLMSPCGKEAAATSVILLTKENLDCKKFTP